jgi:hypothetical protein
MYCGHSPFLASVDGSLWWSVVKWRMKMENVRQNEDVPRTTEFSYLEEELQ